MESYQAPKGVDLGIEKWEDTFNLESSQTEWSDEVWNAVAKDCNHESYRLTINAIKELATLFSIESDVEGCSITPLHFIFAKYIGNDEMIPKMIDKLRKINPATTYLRSVVRLTDSQYDPRRI